MMGVASKNLSETSDIVKVLEGVESIVAEGKEEVE
jgi:hypothetical protein